MSAGEERGNMSYEEVNRSIAWQFGKVNIQKISKNNTNYKQKLSHLFTNTRRLIEIVINNRECVGSFPISQQKEKLFALAAVIYNIILSLVREESYYPSVWGNYMISSWKGYKRVGSKHVSHRALRTCDMTSAPWCTGSCKAVTRRT